MALVVGAGVSILASGGDPRASWIGLLRDGARTAGEADAAWLSTVESRLRDGTVDEIFPIADEIVARLTAHGVQPGGLRRWLAKSVGGIQVKYPDVLHRLIALNTPTITTNYDSLLEDARGDGNYVTWQDFAGVQQVLRKDRESVIHLHGHWNEPESVLLSMESYLRKAGHRVRELQQGLVLSHSLVFVGVGEGMNDPDLSELMTYASRTSKDSSYTHYRLCLEREVADLRAKHRYDNIEVVPYGAEYEDLPNFLRLLAPAQIPGPPPHRPNRPAARVEDLHTKLIETYADRQGLDPRLSVEAKLDALRLVDEDGVLYDWALICFARDPGAFFPGAELKLINASTKAVTTIDGPLPEQVAAGMRTLRELVELPHVDEETSQLFYRALREAISNAVVHRDYDQPGATRIIYGRDSVTIHNPGRLPISIDRSNVLAGISQPPHRHRARILQYLEVAEGAGFGFESFREYRDALSTRFPETRVTVIEEAEQVTTTLTVPANSNERRSGAGEPATSPPHSHHSNPAVRRGARQLTVAAETEDHTAPIKPQEISTERLARQVTPVFSPKAHGELTWASWLETLEQRTHGVSAKELLVSPQKVSVSETPQGWSRLQRDGTSRGLSEALAVRPLRAVIDVGPVNFDAALAVIVEALWESERYVGLVWEQDIDDADLGFLLPENAAPLPVVVASEPVRTYYPIADISHEFVLVTQRTVEKLPLGLDAYFWRIDKLRDDAVMRRLSALAQGELKAEPAAANVLKKLITTSEDVQNVNAAVRPLGSGSSAVDMLVSVETRAATYGLELAKLREMVRFAYPWSFPTRTMKIDLTGESIDQWAALRERKFRWASLGVASLTALLAGVIFLVLGDGIVSAVVFSGWVLLALSAGLLARVRIDSRRMRWYLGLIPFLIVQVSFPLLLRFVFGADLAGVLWAVLVTSLAYCVCRIIGHVRFRASVNQISEGRFYAQSRNVQAVLDAATSLSILERAKAGSGLETPGGRHISGVTQVYSLTSKTLFDWLTRREPSGKPDQ